jgi:hypothetical protein
MSLVIGERSESAIVELVPDTNWYKVTETGIQITAEPTFERWSSEVESWFILHTAGPIVIGDLLNYGELRWPEQFAQVIDGLSQKYQAQTLLNYRSVMRRVPPEVRHPELSFGHYDAVASLPVTEQRQVLERAVEENWSRDETRQMVHRDYDDESLDPPKRYRAKVRKAQKELRDGKVIVVLSEPTSEEGDLPSGSAAIDVREES